jgi:hypothetical protein
LLAELQVEYDRSLMGFDHPYTFRGMTEVPVSWTADDATYYFYLGEGHEPPRPPHEIERAWRDELAAAKRFSSLFSLTIHPWLTGRGHRVLALERLLSEAKADGSIWIANCRQISGHHRNSPNRERFEIPESAHRHPGEVP